MAAALRAGDVSALELLSVAGPLVAHDDEAFHRAHIAWEYRSGQWVLLADERDRMLGWMSWYRVDDAIRDALRALDMAALATLGAPDSVLTAGRHVYFASLVVVPGAPDDVFIKLCQMATDLNLDAESVSWHHRYPDGRSRFVLRPGDWQSDVT